MVFVEYFKVVRVGSWLGWSFSFGFGSIYLSLPSFGRFFIVFCAFALATASVFILNQYFDRREDQENAIKSDMPIASGRISPQTALIFSLSLIVLCLVSAICVDANLLPLFLVYLVFGTVYSAPPLRLKSVPIADFVVSGIGAGFMPFLMGLESAGQLSSDISSIMLGVIPLVLIHCGGHIIQAIGDYEADRKMGVQTFVVRFGKERGTIAAGVMFLSACLSPFAYSVFGLLSYRHLYMFFILFPLSIPIIKRYAALLKKPSTENVVGMQKTATRYGMIGMLLMLGYTLLTNITGL